MAKKLDEELRSSGFVDILRKSLKIVLSRPKIFTQIALFFVLPLNLISLASYVIFSPYFSNKLSPSTFNRAPTASPTYSNEFPNATPSKMAFVYQLGLKVFSLPLNLAFVSTTVYAVACIRSGEEITFRKAISVFPKVWKQLFVTYASIYCTFFVIFAVYLFVILIGVIGIMSFTSNFKSVSVLVGISIGLFIVSLLFMVGIFCVTIIWLLGDVVSVQEKISGLKALKKSKTLIKGNVGTSIATYLVLLLCVSPNVVLLLKLKDKDANIAERISYGFLSLVLTTLVSLLTIVVKTVLYFVCKSYHHEPIDELALVGYFHVSDIDHLP